MHSDLINSGLPNPSPGLTPGVPAESSPAPASRPTLSPNPSPSRERGTSDPLELIAEGRHSIEAVCSESKMSILELAAHVCSAQNLESLARVKQLHDLQREMMLGQLKHKALLRLAELTDEVPAGSADEVRACEIMRKACVDILRFGNGPTRGEGRNSDPGGPGSGGHHPDPITPAFEAEVLEALERLGEEKCDYETRTPGMPKSPPRRESGSVPLDLTLSPPLEVTPLPDIRSRFDMQPGEEPGADTSGSLSKNPTRNPLHHPRPPPARSPPLLPTA